MPWLPAVNADVATVAWLLLFKVPLPKLLAPSKKSTVPVAAGVTVAVKVTESPTVDGFRLDTKPVVVSALLMVCVNTDEVEPL